MEVESLGDPHPDVGVVTYQLHPRVLFRVSDHYTRVQATAADCDRSLDQGECLPAAMEVEQAGVLTSMDPCYTAVGCLLGEQQGRGVEILNSFDMPSVDFDWAMFQGKFDLFKEMYPSIEVVGWYITMPKDSEPGEEHIKLHSLLAEMWCPSPVVMAYDPRPWAIPGQKVTDNALRLFERDEHAAEAVFRLAAYEMHPTDVERIVINQFSDLVDDSEDSTTNKASSSIKNHHKHLKNAVAALVERGTELQQVLIGIKEKRLEYDEGVVMAISAFVDRLPLSEDGMSLTKSHVSSEGLMEQQKDALLKSLIASTMAGLASLETHTSFDARKAISKEERGGGSKHRYHMASANFALDRFGAS